MGEVVRVDLSDDIFTAQVIASACEAEGLRVQLVRNEYPGVGALHALGSAYLLVAAEDEARVREVVARSI